MNLSINLRAIAAACLAAVASFAASRAQAASTYHLVDLGVGTRAFAINAHGVIAGSQGARAAIYRDGAWHPKPAGDYLHAIDDELDLGGAGGTDLLYWPANGSALAIPVPLPIVDGAYLGGIAPGTAVFHGDVDGDANYHCFLWTQAAGTVDITGTTRRCGTSGVNAAGQVAGTGFVNGSPHQTAFLWQNGVFTDLGALGGIESEAVAINARGHVAMTAYNASQDGNSVSRLALYNGHKVVNLGSLSANGAVAYAMNDRDDVVGLAWDKKFVPHPVLSSGGVLTKLDEAIDNLPAGWNLEGPQGIDNAGAIVGTAMTDDGHSHGYLLVPNPQ